jgi:hypothetical protein
MSILLDPRTNDPIINPQGQILFTEDEKIDAVQHFRVWIDTGIGTDIVNPDFGFDIRSVMYAPYAYHYGYDKALEIELGRALDQLGDYIESMKMVTLDVEDHVLDVKISMKTRGNKIVTTTVSIT